MPGPARRYVAGAVCIWQRDGAVEVSSSANTSDPVRRAVGVPGREVCRYLLQARASVEHLLHCVVRACGGANNRTCREGRASFEHLYVAVLRQCRGRKLWRRRRQASAI